MKTLNYTYCDEQDAARFLCKSTFISKAVKVQRLNDTLMRFNKQGFI